jgi:DNA-binding LytR/AlgR family response regulator
MQNRYIILDDDSKSILKIQSVMERFSNFTCIASATTYEEGLNLILEFQPDFVFLEINPVVQSSQFSLLLINELHRYLKNIPKIIAISHDSSLAYEALKYDVIDYLVKPISEVDLRKTFLRMEKNDFSRINNSLQGITPTVPFEQKIDLPFQQNSILNQSERDVSDLLALKNEITTVRESIVHLLSTTSNVIDTKHITDLIIQTISENLAVIKEIDWTSIVNEKVLLANKFSDLGPAPEESKRKLICIKSYGDYRFLELNDLAFLQADNNSTDITLNTGEQITAFKTLKYFEENLPSNFYRIHNSYIVNKDYISRIHTGNSLCYIKNTKNQIPFSKSYKDNIDLLLSQLGGSEQKES